MLGLSVLEGGDNWAIVAEGASPAGDVIEHAGNGSLGRVFDHVGIAVSDLAASERFYRTVLSVLGVEPSHADAELVEWEDWDIGATDREHPVTRGLHVGFRARDRAQVDAFWQLAERDAHVTSEDVCAGVGLDDDHLMPVRMPGRRQHVGHRGRCARRRALHAARPPGLVLVREPDELGLERAHPQLSFGVRLVELAEPNRHVAADDDWTAARLDEDALVPVRVPGRR
jgi:catechol 2,3-dioxygenase-like lactoylglutathione lyase family enzyme